MKALIIVICGCLLAGSPVRAQEAGYAPKQLLVSFNNKEDAVLQVQEGGMTCMYSTVMNVLEKYSATSMRRLYSGDKGAKNIYLIELGNDADVDLAIAELRDNPEIKSVGRNYAIEFLAHPNDWYYNNDYVYPGLSDTSAAGSFLKFMQLDKAWDIQTGSPGATIGILDTGVDFFHQDLLSNIWVNPGEDLDADGVVWDVNDLDTLDNDHNGLVDDLVGWKFVTLSPGDNYPYPDTLQSSYQHGTIMASVGAISNNDLQASDTSIAGISWHCKIVPLRIGEGPGWFVNSTIEALGYAATMGIDVVNMSWYFPYLIDPMSITYLQEAIIAARNAGVVLVAAVDPNAPTTIKYPHGFEEVIAVTVVNEYGVMENGYGYYGGVDVCGLGFSPGKNIPILTYDYRRNGPVLYPGSQAPHGYWYTGMSTSYACAQVSALAGLLRSMYPDSSVDFIKKEIQRGAIPVDTAQGNIGRPWRYMLGAGRINPYRSMTQWGRVRNDTTWAKFAYVSADLTIDQGKTLTIEPGTVIYIAPEDNGNFYFDSEKIAIDVVGTLIANGTAENPIVFKSLSDNPQAGDWYGILFSHETSSGSLSHCNIQDAKYGVVSMTTIAMNACEISNCSIAGIYMYDDMDSTCVVNNESTINKCTISENDYNEASAMRIWNCPLEITVDSCTVNMNFRGIWVSNARPTISWCEIACNQEDGIWVTSYRYTPPYPYPTISRCRIQGNGASGIHCMYNKAQVSYTKSWENETYGLLAYGVDAYPEIDHSKIISNMLAGVRAEVGGTAVLGNVALGKGQNNSLYGQTKNVYNASTTTLYAENCWWGAVPPDQAKMYGTVDYTPYLTSDPVPNLAPAKPDKMPPVFALAQNYPNPFGTSSEATSIKYSIPSSGERVVLRVYDVSGRLVRTLVNGVREGDHYVATWDGRNDRGARVAAGIYFYKLQFGPKTMTKKMVLFR
jgi:hypothetical protein